MTHIDRRAADAAYTEAYERYMATVQPPKVEEFPCRQCGAQQGEPCVMKNDRIGPHAPRANRHALAFMKWGVAAIDAGDAAVNALYATGITTEEKK